MKKVQATARVHLTVEIKVGDVWGADCPFEQVQRQAKETALRDLMNALHRAAMPDPLDPPRRIDLRIVDEPAVTAILVEAER